MSGHMLAVHFRRQQNQGLLPQGTNFDLFRGTAQGARDEVERYPTQVRHLQFTRELI